MKVTAIFIVLVYLAAAIVGGTLGGCSRSLATTYQVPPDKQADAAVLMAKLTDSMARNSRSGDSASSIASAATQQVLSIYGEPVKP